jgi:hypothetical protein
MFITTKVSSGWTSNKTATYWAFFKQVVLSQCYNFRATNSKQSVKLVRLNQSIHKTVACLLTCAAQHAIWLDNQYAKVPKTEGARGGAVV